MSYFNRGIDTVKITVFFNHKPGILNNYIIIIFIARMVILASHVTVKASPTTSIPVPGIISNTRSQIINTYTSHLNNIQQSNYFVRYTQSEDLKKKYLLIPSSTQLNMTEFLCLKCIHHIISFITRTRPTVIQYILCRNRQSKDTGNSGHMTQSEDTTHKAKMMSNTNPTKRG